MIAILAVLGFIVGLAIDGLAHLQGVAGPLVLILATVAGGALGCLVVVLHDRKQNQP